MTQLSKVSFLFSFLISIQLTLQAQPGSGNALDFDKVDDFISFSKVSLPSGLSYGSWVNTTSTDATANYAGNSALTIIGDHTNNVWNSFGIHGGVVRYAHFTTSWNYVTGSTSINDGKWHHVAVTHDTGTDAVVIYVDGKQDASATIDYGNTTSTSKVGYSRIGGSYIDGSGTSDLFDGAIDEVKIFGTALTQTEIRDWMCKKVSVSHPQYANMMAYYKSDNGTGITLSDSKNSNDGTINGASWITSGAAIGDESTHDYANGNTTTLTESHADGSNFTINNFTGTPDGAHIYLVNEAPNSNTNSLSGNLEETRYYGTFVVGGSSPTHSVTYTYSGNTNIDGSANESEAKLTNRTDNSVTSWSNYSSYFDMDDGSKTITKCEQSSNMEYCAGFDNTTLQERPGSGYELAFNGSTQYVNVPDNDDLDLIENWTLETWVNRSAMGTQDGLIEKYEWMAGRGGYILRIIGDIPYAIAVDGTSNNLIMGTTTIQANTWYHIAATFDRTSDELKIYVNGILEGTNASSTIEPPVGYGSLKLGARGDDATNKLIGSMDETRIWSTALSESEIKDWMCKKVTAEHPEYCDLVSYYRYDENTGSTLTDFANGYNGTLINAPTSQMSSVPAGDESVFSYSVTNSTSINLTHSNGDKMTVNVTNAAGADAIQLYRVDDAPNVTIPPSGVEEVSGVNHWGVKVFGGSGLVYEVVYNYDGHPGVQVENNLRLASRASNAATAWTLESATLDVGANTLTLGGQTGTQFILGSTSSNALPVELISFDAEIENEFVKLTWNTASEKDNDFFEIERSLDGGNWKTIERIQSLGNSNSLSSYNFLDKNPLNGQSYYRLKQQDLDGAFTFSPNESVFFLDKKEEILIFPNPTKADLNIVITSSSNQSADLNLYNMQGQFVKNITTQLQKGKNNFQWATNGFPNGIYYLSITKNNNTITKRVVLK